MTTAKPGSKKSRTILICVAFAMALGACSHSQDPAALVSSAKEYIAKRDFKASIIQLKNVLQKQPDNAEARYLLGFAALESGDLATAEVELQKAADLSFPSDDLQVALARTFLAKGDAAMVISQFSSKTLSAPKLQAELRAIVGMAELRRNSRQKAETTFNEALAIDAGNVSANMGIARLTAVGGDLPGALSRVESALASAPANFEAHMLRADLLAAQGQSDEAIKAYRAAIEAAPAEVAPRMSLVAYLLRQRSLDAAAAEAEALHKSHPKDVRSFYARAMVLVEQRKYAEARDAVQQVLKVLPEHVPSLLLGGMAALQTGAYAEAESHLRKAVFKAPNAMGAKRLLATTHLRMGQNELAMTEVKEVLAKAGQDPEILALAGETYLAVGDIDGAAKHYERAKKLAPENVRMQTRLAQIRFAAGETDKGFAELQAASAGSAEDYQPDLALVATHLRQRHPDKALEALQILEKKQPKNPLTHNLRGVALLMKRDMANARASFERAVELNPTYMAAVANLARLDLAEKKPENAKKRYEAVLKKEPNNEQALLGLAVLLRVSGADPKDIEKLLKRSIAANPSLPAARAALTNFYLRTHDFKAALGAAQDAAAALPNNASVTEFLGVAQLAAGESRQAIASFTRFAEMMPKSPQPQVRLASAHVAAKQPDEAIKALRAALRLNPDLTAAQRDIAAIYVATGRADQALKEARSVQVEHPKQPLGYVLEGEIYVHQKKFDAAEKVYRDAMKRFDLPVLATRTHQVLTIAGKKAEADTLADGWVKTHPKDPFVLNYLAERDLAGKRYDAAAQRYQAALQRAPDNPLLLNNLAWVAHELKQPKALEYSERAHELAPENPAIMDTLGGILVASGETERGLELLGRAAELAPEAYHIRLNFAKALLKANRKNAARKELEVLAKLDSRLPAQQEAAKLLGSL
jgi:putative PEP-CTERM system TPR-repeat lipoprotein